MKCQRSVRSLVLGVDSSFARYRKTQPFDPILKCDLEWLQPYLLTIIKQELKTLLKLNFIPKPSVLFILLANIPMEKLLDLIVTRNDLHLLFFITFVQVLDSIDHNNGSSLTPS